MFFATFRLGCAMSTRNSRMLGQVPQKLSIFESSTRWLLGFQVELSRVLSGKIEFSPKKLEKKCSLSRSLNLLFRSLETKHMAFQESISWLFNVILHIWCYKSSALMGSQCTMWDFSSNFPVSKNLSNEVGMKMKILYSNFGENTNF